MKAVRRLQITAGRNHQSNNNIVAIYIGLPVVDAAQDNVVIEAVESTRAEPQNMALSVDGGTLWVEYINVEPGFTDEITITFSIDLYERHASFGDIKPYNTQSLLYQRYTAHRIYDGSEVTDDENNSEFKLLNEANITPGMNSFAKAKRIYNYLHHRLSYGRPAAIAGGATVHCGTYADLFVRLCRAAGVPARRCAGFAFDSPADDPDKTVVSGHNWAEFYIEPIGWIPVDPTMGDKKDKRKAYYFGTVDNARLCVSKSGFHDRLPLRYKTSADGPLIFTGDASDFEPFKCPDTIQGVHRFQYRYDKPIQISVHNPYGPSLTVLSRQGAFTKSN